jgi:hypothetical protein
MIPLNGAKKNELFLKTCYITCKLPSFALFSPPKKRFLMERFSFASTKQGILLAGVH